MDKKLKKIYYILLNGRGCMNGKGVVRGVEEHVDIHLEWVSAPTNFASAMLYHNYPERCEKEEVVRLEKCQERKE
jgi:hypothetical protein